MAATPISLALRGGAALVIDGIGGASAGAINACYRSHLPSLALIMP